MSTTNDVLEVITKIRDGIDQLFPLLNALELELNLKAQLKPIHEELDHLKTVIQQSENNIDKRIVTFQDVLKKQSDQLFLSDKQHKDMVERIYSILDGIEDYLRRHA